MSLALRPSWEYLKRLSLFRPYPDEVPWALFDSHPAPDMDLDPWIQAALDDDPRIYLRVAKRDDQVVGVYLMEGAADASSPTFTLHYLLVVTEERRQGLGRYLLRHAMGIAESKGGHRLAARTSALDRFLRGQGFAPAEETMVAEFTPE